MITFNQFNENLNEDFNFLLKSNNQFSIKVAKTILEQAQKNGISIKVLKDFLEMILNDAKLSKDINFLENYIK